MESLGAGRMNCSPEVEGTFWKNGPPPSCIIIRSSPLGSLKRRADVSTLGAGWRERAGRRWWSARLIRFSASH